MYDLALDRPDTLAVSATEVGELVGFAYGHRWSWQEQTDEWSLELAAELGESAADLEGSCAIAMLAVHPSFTRQGLGFETLKRFLIASGSPVHWVLTADANSPSRRLYRRMGFRPLGHGPQTAAGEPGLVLIHG